MAKKPVMIEDEPTPPPRLREQVDAEAGDVEPESASDNRAARMPSKSRASSRTRGGATTSTSGHAKRMTLTLSPRAYKRLDDYCHITKERACDVVGRLILDPVHGLKSATCRLNESTRDTGEDRQDGAAA